MAAARVESGGSVVVGRPQKLLQMVENNDDMEGVTQKQLEDLFCSWLCRDETMNQVEEWRKLAMLGQLQGPAETVSLHELVHHGRILGSPRSPPASIDITSPKKKSDVGGGHQLGPSELLSLPLLRKRHGVNRKTPRGTTRRRSGSLEDEESKITLRWKEAAAEWQDQQGLTKTTNQKEIYPELPLLVFAPLAAELCDLPMIAGPLIFARVTTPPPPSSAGGGAGGLTPPQETQSKEEKGKTTASLTEFLSFWRSACFGDRQKRAERLFAVLAQPGAKGISRHDLDPLLKFVVTTHPGLAFLEEHAEFQAKYSATVIARIFYRINLSRSGEISRRELCLATPDLVDALYQLESTDDVNSETSFFSYEHFYVLYCQFWELDADKDAKLTRTDLLKYGGHRLSRAIVDRVFEAAPRPFADGACGATRRREILKAKKLNNALPSTTTKTSMHIEAETDNSSDLDIDIEEEDKDKKGEEEDDLDKTTTNNLKRLTARYRREEDENGLHGGRRTSLNDDAFLDTEQADAMTYADFVYFMLSEEDKGNEASLRYWFTCVDVDGDGIIDARDAKHFYDVQAQRMECLGHELVPLEDVLCQMADLLDSGSSSSTANSAKNKKNQLSNNFSSLRLTVKHFLEPSKLRVAGVFFDALFSLDKFVAFEQRDPFAERLKRDDPFDFEWERFAAHEYSRLATEDDDDEDDEEASGGSSGGDTLDIDDPSHDPTSAPDDRYTRRGNLSGLASNEAPF